MHPKGIRQLEGFQNSIVVTSHSGARCNQRQQNGRNPGVSSKIKKEMNSQEPGNLANIILALFGFHPPKSRTQSELFDALLGTSAEDGPAFSLGPKVYVVEPALSPKMRQQNLEDSLLRQGAESDRNIWQDQIVHQLPTALHRFPLPGAKLKHFDPEN